MNTQTKLDKFAVGEEMHKRALTFAAATPKDVDAAVTRQADVAEEKSTAPIVLMMGMLKSMPESMLDELPRIGSTIKDSNNPDLFTWRDPNKDNDDGKIVSFYVIWADNTPEGKAAVQELDWLRRMSDDNMSKAGIPQEYQDKYSNAQLIEQRKKKMENRRANVRKAYKTAVRLMHKFDEVNELAAVAAEVEPGLTEGTFEPDILVHSTIKGRENKDWKHYSVTNFLKLNAAKAAEQGGTLAALKATVARDTDKGKGKAGIPALNSIETPETMDKVALPFYSYLDAAFADKRGDKYAALLKHLTGAGAEQPVLTLGGIRDILNALFRIDKVQSIYDKAKEETQRAAA